MLGLILSGFNEAICKFFIGAAVYLFDVYYDLIGKLTGTSYLTADLENIFGNQAIWETIKTINQTLVIPIGEGILGLFMLVQLVKISQRIDATATLPAVKDIVFLFVIYTIMHWLIVNSLDIMTGLYDVINKIVSSDILNNQTAHDDFQHLIGNYDESSIDWGNASVGSCFALFLFGIISWFAGGIVYLIGTLMALARGIQLYIYSAFSPIPLSLLGFEETRQSGISFLKNFCAVALSGAIMIFSLILYPKILIAITVSNEGYGSLITDIASGEIVGDFATTLLKGLAVTFLAGFALVKSGSWAKELLGN